MQGIDEYYAAAMALFVEEEHRHANILAMCVRLLNGTVIRSNWTARLFVFGRRICSNRVLRVAERLNNSGVTGHLYILVSIVIDIQFNIIYIMRI